MTNKRALIVDDSRSARVILSRMLEAYDLQVDTAESAEQALEYLRQARPDVIFMDHLMPGMDGFQAIAAIKSNPDTATIPVMMYTSQEGELYVSQARALGAVGVLPKTVKQGDVSRVLYQLHLLPERRDANPGLFPPEGQTAAEARIPRPQPAAMRTGSQPAVQIERPPVTQAGEIETAIRNAIAPALREYNAELRRYIAASMEVLSRKISPVEPRPAEAEAAVPTEIPPPATASRWPLTVALSVIALIPTVVLGVMYWQMHQATQALMQSNAHLASVVEEQQAQLATLQQASRAAADNPVSAAAEQLPGKLERQSVPYGEQPLGGARLERLQAILDELRVGGFKGRVKAATYVGEFCLTGNGIEGYSVAADDLPLKRCDLIGNPFEDSLTAAQRQSLAFANLIASVQQQTANALSVDIVNGGRAPAIAYPEGESLARATAGEWNRIAAQNNRVEFLVETE